MTHEAGSWVLGPAVTSQHRRRSTQLRSSINVLSVCLKTTIDKITAVNIWHVPSAGIRTCRLFQITWFQLESRLSPQINQWVLKSVFSCHLCYTFFMFLCFRSSLYSVFWTVELDSCYLCTLSFFKGLNSLTIWISVLASYSSISN